VLTIDENIQRKAEKVLQGVVDSNNGRISAASALIMEPTTGKVWAMANYPTYDPGKYWVEKDANVFVNRVAETPYEPASVCKPFTYAAALNEGKINPDQTYYNAGYTEVGDRKMSNASGSEHLVGTLTFRKALDHSLNTGSIEVLRRMGGGDITKEARQTLYHYLHDNFGLGLNTGVEVHEAAGTIISPENEEGNAVRYANMTFGQGMNLTMLQVAAGFSSLVNGGEYYQPTIIAGTYENKEKQPVSQQLPVRRTINESTSTEMRKMLEEVRSVNGGKNDLPGYRVGVKTGTAETIDSATGAYTSKRTNASVVGYGGENVDGALPKYVVMIRLDGETLLWGAKDAIPVFTELSNYMLQYLRVEPK
jgi:cell division protein FtsI/penicillin-binding protein 2